jgi:hypothetical protein
MKLNEPGSDPANSGGPISEELEAHLLRALQSPAIEVTREYVEAKHRALKMYRDGTLFQTLHQKQLGMPM